MISQIPTHILILVPSSILFSIPAFILAFKAHYTRFAWFTGFTCVATLVFHVVLGIITAISLSRNRDTQFSNEDPSSEKTNPTSWSNSAELAPPSPTSSIATIHSKPRLLRYYTSGGIFFQCILLAFWIACWVMAIADTARGPNADTGSKTPASMSINAPWNTGVQVAEIIFVLLECIPLGILVFKCWRVKRETEARIALIAEERKFNVIRSGSIRREPSFRQPGRDNDDALPSVPPVAVKAHSRFSTDSRAAGPVNDRTASGARSNPYRLTQARYASLRSPSQPDSGVDRKNSGRRVLDKILNKIPESSNPSSESVRPLPVPPTITVTIPTDTESSSRDNQAGGGNGAAPAQVAVMMPEPKVTPQADTLATNSLNDLIRQAASVERKIDTPQNDAQILSAEARAI
ncbi:hypothetical protein VKT23_010703 [Stygiomarasmius scandens]|uniref:Uncharacterized protein n=1 Tax=Marasmiellus scandens TaxID=2682957 RepID=A0ABR1JFS7_9AGAR